MGANGANYANLFLGNLLCARAGQPALPHSAHPTFFKQARVVFFKE
jgi:hypothetical protein